MSSHPLAHTVDIRRAQAQHQAYVDALVNLGLDVTVLPPLPLPDSCFVEDTAVVRDNRAVLTRPRPESRRPEVDAIAPVLGEHFDCVRVEAPATLEGGDVIHLSDRLVVGVSSRTTPDGVEQLRTLLGVHVDTVTDTTMMHLKSHVTAVSDTLFVCTPRFTGHRALRAEEVVVVPPPESHAANTLTINGTVLLPAGCPLTTHELRERGFDVVELEMDQFRLCDGALTCLSVLF